MKYSAKEIYNQSLSVIKEAVEKCKLKQGDVFVVGCSTSEVTGGTIGHNSDPDTADRVFSAIYDYLKDKGIYLACQCCEHLNRAIIIEKEAALNYTEVNVVPQPKAGGSFATAAYKNFKNPVAVENIRADAGIDIGLTLIGMHLKNVAVPVRLENNKIGNAIVVCARTRPKFIGGIRAIYNEDKM